MKVKFAAAAFAGLGLFALTGCTKPTPEVTIWSGTSSVVRPATCWAPDTNIPQAVRDCISQANTRPAGEIPTLAVAPGTTLGINVDPDIAEATWLPSISGQPLSQKPLSDSYFRFDFPSINIPDEGFILTVTARGTAADQDRGLWLFRIVPPAE